MRSTKVYDLAFNSSFYPFSSLSERRRGSFIGELEYQMRQSNNFMILNLISVIFRRLCKMYGNLLVGFILRAVPAVLE